MNIKRLNVEEPNSDTDENKNSLSGSTRQISESSLRSCGNKSGNGFRLSKRSIANLQAKSATGIR
jgi:hypothetical protein